MREQAYEQPLAGGRYHYRRQGHSTGSYESWRLTRAAGGYRFLRVDLNADAGEGGDSTIYHLTLNPNGGPERLSFRHFRRGPALAGNLLFDGGTVTLTQSVAADRTEEVITLPEPYAFWFPATAALSLPAALPPCSEYPALILSKGQTFTLQQATVSVREQPPVKIRVMGASQLTKPVTVEWQQSARSPGQRTLWLDAFGWPLQMARDDGLLAVETRYLRYRAREEG